MCMCMLASHHTTLTRHHKKRWPSERHSTSHNFTELGHAQEVTHITTASCHRYSSVAPQQISILHISILHSIIVTKQLGLAQELVVALALLVVVVDEDMPE